MTVKSTIAMSAMSNPSNIIFCHFLCFYLPQALLHTRNVSAEEAAMYYFNKLENEVPIR